ncbi:flap endonuclease-1 [Enteropsectra breve]|nr:flap endonuclease-1 [Enteropsectra breve]
MGIKQLSKLIKEKTKTGLTIRKMGYYAGSAIAIDASMSIYQFLVAVRSDGANLGFGDATTSHLIGIFYRTIKFIEAGITPVYVFDGKAPANKIHELTKRAARREEAEKLLEEAIREGDTLTIEKMEKRKIKVDGTHIAEVKKLLTMMGVPVVDAFSEAEAHCAFLCREGCVKGVATEDMDALCFGTPLLLRNFNVSQSAKLEINEYNLQKILKEMEMDLNTFIDMCILLGCDYCETIKGVGPKKAFEYIKKHGSIEKILENENLAVPEKFNYQGAREIFQELPKMGNTEKFAIDYERIDKDGLVDFLCKEKSFNEQRVLNGVEKIMKARKTGSQMRLESFFKKN